MCPVQCLSHELQGSVARLPHTSRMEGWVRCGLPTARVRPYWSLSKAQHPALISTQFSKGLTECLPAVQMRQHHRAAHSRTCGSNFIELQLGCKTLTSSYVHLTRRLRCFIPAAHSDLRQKLVPSRLTGAQSA